MNFWQWIALNWGLAGLPFMVAGIWIFQEWIDGQEPDATYKTAAKVVFLSLLLGAVGLMLLLLAHTWKVGFSSLRS
jgi:hypothetical protein